MKAILRGGAAGGNNLEKVSAAQGILERLVDVIREPSQGVASSWPAIRGTTYRCRLSDGGRCLLDS